MEYFEQGYKVCRICNSNCSQFFELTYNCAENFAYKLSVIVPEVDLSLSFNPIICKECARILEEAYSLRLRCLETQSYLHNPYHNTSFKSSIDQNISSPAQFETNAIINNCCKLEVSDIQITIPNIQQSAAPSSQKTKEEEFLLEEIYTKAACKNCAKELHSKDKLEVHKDGNLTEEPVECPTCNKLCHTKRQLKSHARVHEDLKPFTCDKCAKCFRTKQQLTTHTNIHEDRKLFLCNECGKGFSAKGNLIVHTRCHTGEKPYMCPICNKKFTVKCNMQYHLKHTHGTQKEIFNV